VLLSRRAALAGATALAAGGGTRAWAQPRGQVGERLFALVQAYCKWPHHRSGTPEGRNTVAWMDGELKKMGAPAKRIPYQFERYEFFVEVKAKGGRPLEALPLFYEAFNQVSSTTPIIRPVTLENNVDRKDIASSISSPPNAKSPIVLLPTFGKFGAEAPRPALIGVDADPARKGSGIPTVMISGEHLETLKAGGVSVEFRASRVSDRDHTVIAELGAGGLRPLVITTPIGGWFTAAGERGTGIAIALELAAHFARDMPVIFIATTGNELEFNGTKSLIKWGYRVEPYGVVHIGAAAGAGVKRPGDRAMSLAPTRVGMSTRPAGPNTGMAAALKIGGFAGTENFSGEGAIWREFLGKDVPLLSFDGTFPLMRTPDDVAELATTPALLETAYRSVLDATRMLLAA